MPDGVQYLDGPRLQRCLLAGLQQLIARREHLNHINVFPVPDGDTGNNLAHTAAAAQRAIHDLESTSVSELLNRLATGALDGAQGNSGTMLAQYFQGLADSLKDRVRIDTAQLADAFTHAAEATRTALENPREGTILSVMDAAARAGESLRDTGDFARMLPKLRDATAKALTETTAQLEELRKANVVDAGAQGYLCILEGCVDYLLHGSLHETPEISKDFGDDVVAHDLHDIDLENRYCTECMIVGNELNRHQVRSVLQPMGNSLVIAGSGQRLKIHIHTNNPERVFEIAADYGEVANTKADDMVGQARALQQADRDVAIVTDSAADIPEDVMAELGIHMVPLRVQFGEESFLDKTGISSADFSAELASNPHTPGTSQPTPGDYRRMYEFLGSHFRELLSVHLSGALSGTLQGAKTAAARSELAERIHIVDSVNVSVGQGLIAKAAAELASDGLRGDELANRVADIAAQVETFGIVNDLSSAVRSGRLQPAVKHLADWLRLTPILTKTTDGRVRAGGFLPGRFRTIERFAKFIGRKVDKDTHWEIAIAHGNGRETDAQQLHTALTERLTHVKLAWTTEIGVALGVHAGMEALVVSLRPVPPE